METEQNMKRHINEEGCWCLVELYRRRWVKHWLTAWEIPWTIEFLLLQTTTTSPTTQHQHIKPTGNRYLTNDEAVNACICRLHRDILNASHHVLRFDVNRAKSFSNWIDTTSVNNCPHLQNAINSPVSSESVWPVASFEINKQTFDYFAFAWQFTRHKQIQIKSHMLTIHAYSDNSALLTRWQSCKISPQ